MRNTAACSSRKDPTLQLTCRRTTLQEITTAVPRTTKQIKRLRTRQTSRNSYSNYVKMNSSSKRSVAAITPEWDSSNLVHTWLKRIANPAKDTKRAIQVWSNLIRITRKLERASAKCKIMNTVGPDWLGRSERARSFLRKASTMTKSWTAAPIVIRTKIW